MSTILDIHGEPIEPVWAAEFRGFFLGEGSLEIGQINHSVTTRRGDKVYQYQAKQLRPRARLIQRDDNRAILEAVQARLGGNITKHGRHYTVSPVNGMTYSSNPTIAWYVMSTESVQRVLDLLKGGVLPHSKLREVALLEEFLAIRPRPGHKLTDTVRARSWELKAEIEALRKYQVG